MIDATLFWSKVAIGGLDECWPIRCARSVRGYGICTFGDRTYRAHRVAYALTRGSIPEALFVLHRCDNPPCCNPVHLYAGTHADNMVDMTARGRAAKGDRHGRHTKPARSPRGEWHGMSKLTAEKVIEIRAALKAGASQRGIARRYGVNPRAIWGIRTGETWRHVP
jgi:HNH endonuclease